MQLKAININAFAAEEIESLDDNTVLISINPELPEALFRLKIDRNDEKVITLRFSDVTEIKGYNGYFLHPINKKQTLELLEFIEKYKDKNFIIHCAAGISRSAAVALYLHETYGHELKPRFKQICHPNYWVVNMLRTRGEYKH